LLVIVSCHSQKIANFFFDELKLAEHVIYVPADYQINDHVARYFTVEILKAIFKSKFTYCKVIKETIA
jgi:hypothetical protein